MRPKPENLFNRKKKRNKKGSMIDVFFVIVTIVGLAIFILIMSHVTPKITDGLKEIDELNETNSSRQALDAVEENNNKLDGILLFVFVGLIIGIFITAFLIDSHPIFVPIYIFLLGFAVLIGVIMNKVYESFYNSEVLNETARELTFTTAILNNYVPIVIGVGIITMIIIFAKPKQQGNV